MTRPVRAVFPGSFNPLTVAHLALAEAALSVCDHVDLAVSKVALGKESVERPRLEERLAALRAAASTRPWMGVVVTSDQLLADIARSYDVLVLGSDKWAQVQDVSFYGGSAAARDAALASLPPLVVAGRGDGVPLPEGAKVLELDPGLSVVSSSAVRAGEWSMMAPEAAAVDARCGAWSDAERYEAWLASLEEGEDPWSS